jgi:hypothetical protein
VSWREIRLSYIIEEAAAKEAGLKKGLRLLANLGD